MVSDQLIGSSPPFIAEIRKLQRVAPLDATVLISGESGTGKELCAQLLHELSPRVNRPFIPVNCGAIPLDLIENELFGHEAGAFTGAANSRHGLVCEAEGGTLFLDEVDCLPLLAQIKLLRLLQQRDYRPLGSTRLHRANIRVVAATNSDLNSAVREQRFRRDLFYRLHSIAVTLPPLRIRREDIPQLVNHFVTKYASEFKSQVKECSSDVLRVLYDYEWPGNVRELEYVIQQAVALCPHSVLTSEYIPVAPTHHTIYGQSFRESKAQAVKQFEMSYIQGLLVSYQGNISKAAHAAGKNRRAFWQLIRKHGIIVEEFRKRG